jgi:hypothetical protein
MKIIYFCIFLLAVVRANSAGVLKALDCHDQVVRHGVESLVLPKEVELLFGATNVDHFISEFRSKTHIPIWNSVTYFSDRYMFTMQIPVLIAKRKIASDSIRLVQPGRFPSVEPQ